MTRTIDTIREHLISLEGHYQAFPSLKLRRYRLFNTCQSGARAVHRADTAGRSKSGQYVCSCRVHRLVEVLTANTESARLGTSAEIIWRGYSRGRHQNRQLVRLPRPTRIVLGRRPQPTANGRPRASRVPAPRSPSGGRALATTAEQACGELPLRARSALALTAGFILHTGRREMPLTRGSPQLLSM